jgi:hypothetical protein
MVNWVANIHNVIKRIRIVKVSSENNVIVKIKKNHLMYVDAIPQNLLIQSNFIQKI